MADKIETDSNKLRARADQLDKLRSEFPDLREYRGRWETVLVSKGVNPIPESVYTKHTCGCCQDAGLDAWFYITRHGERVYTDPPTISVGRGNECYCYGDDEPRDILYEDWRDRVKRHVGDLGVDLLKKYSPQFGS